MDNTITAKELIDLIVSTKPTAEVENDENLYPTPQGEIEIDEEGICSLVVHPDLGSSLDMGNFYFEVGGVYVTVGRDVGFSGKWLTIAQMRGLWLQRLFLLRTCI